MITGSRTEKINVYIGLEAFNSHIYSKVYRKEGLELTSTLFVEKKHGIDDDQMDVLNSFNDFIALDSFPKDENNRIDRQQLYLLMKHQRSEERRVGIECRSIMNS